MSLRGDGPTDRSLRLGVIIFERVRRLIRPRSAWWRRGLLALLMCAVLTAAIVVTAVSSVLYGIYFDREHLPDPGPLTRFEFPTIGHVYDIHGQPLIELAMEYRQITQYAEIPPIVREAILATEDKRFFAHNGVDYLSIPRVVTKIRGGAWMRRLWTGGRGDGDSGPAIFPQGGSTITQQLVRGVFLQHQTTEENSYQLRTAGLLPRLLSSLIGARNTNMMIRKREEIRLSVWIEEWMRERLGSKRLAKEALLARYASFVYMGRGQYGFARAAEYYFGRSLASFTVEDADKAAILAGIAKSPRDYAPTTKSTSALLRRRNQTLALMAGHGVISAEQLIAAERQPLPAVAPRALLPFQSSAVVQHVLDELKGTHHDLGVEDLLQGDIQVYSTVDARVQRLSNDALERGLEQYEQRHPSARGVVQGSIVVLRNRDGSILAETGGRLVYRGRRSSYSDFNRVTQSLRQPGSAMKPLVYLAAFRRGGFTLDTLVPDEPISVPMGNARGPKWIANYDGRFKGWIPIRQALAESRNAVAIWLTAQVGIDAVLEASRSLGVQTTLQRYPTTALGASEVNLLELATAYRTIASGVLAQPYIIRRIGRDSGEAEDAGNQHQPAPTPVNDAALSLVQEGLRGVVRIPSGTAHALTARAFPIAAMGKTGTTSDFRDALFVGSTYGLDGITVAVRIGFDDNRSLGGRETGGRAAMPIFQELMFKIYDGGHLIGPAPSFPGQMEDHITRYLQGDQPALPDGGEPSIAASSPPPSAQPTGASGASESVALAAPGPGAAADSPLLGIVQK